MLGLAAMDALNPFSIAAMAVLLAMDRPAARGGIFIAGTAAVYVAFGVALVEGWTAVITRLLPALPAWSPAAVEIGLGALCLVAAIHVWWQAGGTTGSAQPSSATPLGVGAFAALSTLADLPTALPYFAAASQIPMLTGHRLGQYAWLGVYNLIYVTPLMAMLGARLAFGAGAEGVLSTVRRAVNWLFQKLLPWLLLLVGLALLVDGTISLLILSTLVWLMTGP